MIYDRCMNVDSADRIRRRYRPQAIWLKVVLILMFIPCLGRSEITIGPKRIEVWQSAMRDLDLGRNQSVILKVESMLLVSPQRLELADLYFTALGRTCIPVVPQGWRHEPLASFAEGAAHRGASRYALAASAYQRASCQSVVSDTWSRSVSLVNAAECLAYADERTRSLALLDSLAVIVRGDETLSRVGVRALHVRGLLHRMESEPEAKDLFTRALTLADSLDARSVMCDCWSGLGTSETLGLALAEAERLEDPYRMVRLLVNSAYMSGDWSLGGGGRASWIARIRFSRFARSRIWSGMSTLAEDISSEVFQIVNMP